MDRRNKKLVVGLGVLVCILGGICILARNAIRSLESMKDDLAKNLHVSNALSPEDSSLFKQSAWDSLKVSQVFNLKGSSPISSLAYNATYKLVICRVDFKTDPDLERDLAIDDKKSDVTTGVSYFSIIAGDFLTCKLQARQPKNVAKLHLSLLGDSLKSSVKNTVSDFRLLCKNLSIRYDKADTNRIFMTGNEQILGVIKPVPIELRLLVKGKAIYIVVLTPIIRPSNINPGILDSILKVS